MGDVLLGVVTAPVLKKVLSLAAEELSLAWGLDKKLRKLADKVQMIHALLSDAQSKQSTSEAVRLWLQKLQRVSLDAEDVLDKFGYEVLRKKIENRKRDKVRSFLSSSNPLSFRLKVAHEIKDVISSLEELFAESHQIGLRAVELISSLPHLKEKRITDPFVENSEIVGRDEDTSKVINMLTGSDYCEKALPVITIQGMGGQGKTTLAQLIYKNAKVQSHFDKRVWVCVSNDFNVERLLADMLQSLIQTNHQLTITEALVGKLKEELNGKRYLLVLDDVWNKNRDEWGRMKGCLLEIGGSEGSKILATTRELDVVSTMRTSECHRLQILSEEQSWELFEKQAFAKGGATKSPELVHIGKRILQRCGGVPLAIKAIGGLLYSKHSESQWLTIEKSGVWSDSFNGGNKVLSIIKLSYDHLPFLSVKQCFAYCAMFEKDTRMGKDMLIQLWMAQGLLNPPEGSVLQMEDIGTEYFDILLRSSLLQDAERDDLNNITHCKMHDLVHDVSLEVSKNYCFHVKDWKQVKKKIEAVHLSITAGERGMWKSLKGFVPSNLRTLHLKGCNVLEEDLSANFECLSVLIVDDEDAEELPNWIGKMKHLRFLDIASCYDMVKLPKSLTELYYLQTLRASKLDAVPKGFSQKLINLRHFYTEGISAYLLPGIGQLTNLQTLSFFKADKCNGCQIEELEHLHNLKGELRIFGLQNVSSRESALKANLSKKSNIQTLEFCWGCRRLEDCEDTDVIEGLKPHLNLKSLEINGYQSPKFPSWMMAPNDDLLLLRGLMKITLRNLGKCERLPSLGNLPSLEYLEICWLQQVERIGKEFYGWSNLDWERKNSVSKGAEITIFPALRQLELSWMEGLVEWSDAIIPTQSSIKAFPHLERIHLSNLPNLIAFPNLGILPYLREMDIIGCRCLVNVADIHCLHSVDTLSIVYCDKLTTSCSLMSSVPYKSMTIKCNPSLWPDLQHLTNLRTLVLEANSDELDCFPFPYLEDVQHFVSLTALELRGYRSSKVMSFSNQIQSLTTLRDLKIWGFDVLEDLPEWLGNLQCLRNLEVWHCTELKQLPSAEAFQRLTNLQNLTIEDCPLLIERCTKGSGSEWSKIAHIPNLDLISDD